MSYLKEFPRSEEIYLQNYMYYYSKEKKLLRIKSNDQSILLLAIQYYGSIYDENGEEWEFITALNIANIKKPEWVMGLNYKGDDTETFITFQEHTEGEASRSNSHFESFFFETEGKINFLDGSNRECMLKIGNDAIKCHVVSKVKIPVGDKNYIEILEADGKMPIIMSREGYVVTYAVPYGIRWYKPFKEVILQL